ncbi:discoidin domain-containing protein [Ulvibacter litoralis]|uniref:Por secretion system C-terminal sorting domain-containing protein n=1 Tax=Ulvibacter litoralis TaxID=227084 RepID=A0A1G7GHL6_9FLAO|nr:discoidin domain-containing protein [Ulvibacter litoralis]GHC56148.1 hypothetical protein GCM10008083_20770 [Ulvibacter litoralis]SDE87616.1 Por secretion system C-terminal sorting domain-containing protein [Ulvibacter litoralis]
MRKILFFVCSIALFAVCTTSCKEDKVVHEKAERPLLHLEQAKIDRRNNGEVNPDKTAPWTPEQAARHQLILAKLVETSENFSNGRSNTATYADGALAGKWVNRGPKNMPGAFKFAEMLDGTDIIYGVTHNHYVGEYNSTSHIYKGTVYNPTTGVGGDDFQVLTANWPNRYDNLFAFTLNAGVRLVAHIESGPIYYSDDEGSTWTVATGLPAALTSAAINRQDNNAIYVTDDTSVYVSTDQGVSFTLFQNFGSSAHSSLYTPRYAIQPNASTMYLARNGSFYSLTTAQSQFVLKGSYTTSHNNGKFSVAGDSRKLYVTVDNNYWVSVDEGVTWTQKTPHGNYYGDTSGTMDAGKFLAVSPVDEDIVIAGYAHPVVSTTGLNTVYTDHAGWGNYQNGTELPQQDYYNRIRFNYHPDFQASHFFYNSSGTLLSVRCTDGGIYVSYKEWFDFPAAGAGYNNSGYANAHFINVTLLNTITPLVYRNDLFTGKNDPNHINSGTQDQGSQSIIPGTTGDVLDFYQSIGGDGQSIDSQDGENAWRWSRKGDMAWSPVKVYTAGGGFRSIGEINGDFNSSASVNFSQNTALGWVQTYIDHKDPDKNIWLLAKDLNRAKWDGTNFTAHTVSKGTNQVSALAQGTVNGDKLFMLQDGKVFASSDRGDTFDAGTTTPFSKTTADQNIGSGVVLPGNDNWILFSGPSENNVGSILSKDGGLTWNDVTGIFPAGNDAQTGGMIVTPDAKYVFAGTDIGPYVFDVSKEKWFSIAEGIGFINITDVDYIASINTVRFASWGSGVIDFNIEEIVGGCTDTPIAQNTYTLYSVDSQQGSDPGANAFDGDINTIWHTQYSPTTDSYPHSIVIDLGSSKNVSNIKCMPRQSSPNGRIANYEIYVNDDPLNFGAAVASGTWTNTTDEKTVSFTPKEGRYVQLKALSEVNGNAWASMAEINISECVGECSGGTTTYISGAWSHGAPDATKTVIIAENYSTALGDINACELQVDPMATLTITDGKFVKVEKDIAVKGNLLIQHQGSLVQVDDTALVTKDGTITIEKTTPTLAEKKFMIMGSPMTAETREGVYSASYIVRHHNTTNFVPNPAVASAFPSAENFADDNGNNWLIHTGIVTPAEGYMVFPQPNSTGSGSFTHSYTQGTLNNGVVIVPLKYHTDQNSSPNMLANPYASAIDANAFYANPANAAIDVLYFWEHITPLSVSYPGYNAANFSMGDISMYSEAMGGIPAGNGGTAPTGIISSGQGFAVKAASAGINATFNNAMRVTGPNDTYRRPASERDRLWINVYNDTYGLGSTTLIGFSETTTDTFEANADIKRLATPVSLYSELATGEELAINALGSFEIEDAVALSFSTQVKESQNYRISLQDVEGVNIESATVLLIDNLLGTVTNLNEGDYSFQSEEGTYSERFKVVFENRILATNNLALNSVSVYPNPAKNNLYIVSSEALIINAVVYDLQGRQVQYAKSSNMTNIQIDLSSLNSAVYFVKITTNAGVITRRVMKD